MLNLEYEIQDKFFNAGLKSFFSIQSDCYRLTLFNKNSDQTMLFIPKKDSNQITEIVDYVYKYSKNKYPELFL